MTTAFTFTTVPKTLFQPGSSARLAETAAPALKGAKRILFVTDQGVLKAGLADAALAGLKDAGLQVHVYDKVVADPPESTVFEAVAEGQEFGAEAVIGSRVNACEPR